MDVSAIVAGVAVVASIENECLSNQFKRFVRFDESDLQCDLPVAYSSYFSSYSFL